MARLGAEVTMVGCVGNDPFGETLIRSLSDAGVNTRYIIKKDNISTGCAQITLDVSSSKAANRIIVLPEANYAFTKEDISFLEDIIKDFNLVVLQHEINMKVNIYVAKIANENNVEVMLNPAPADKIPDEMLRYITYISPNEHEAYKLTGVKISQDGGKASIQEAKNAADKLIKLGIRNVLITLGSRGCIYSNGEKFIHCPSIKTKAVDTTAAGDSFIGAFCVKVHKGSSIEDAMIFASHAASLTVSKLGAQPSLPTLEEVETSIKTRS